MPYDLIFNPVDLKYLSPTQILEVLYEGKTRRFELHSVSPLAYDQDNSVTSLAQSLQSLDLAAPPQIWTVGWDCFVTILDDNQEIDNDKVMQFLHRYISRADNSQESKTRGIESGVSPDAYSSVGGLDKQISQIRDLIDLPLTRPELFLHLGAWYPLSSHHRVLCSYDMYRQG